jgi:RNA-directed DNA polymerase
VIGNKGSAGIDGMSVAELKPYLVGNWRRIREELLEGRYRPQAVLRVDILKGGGGMRELGIPTVVDRLYRRRCIRC